MSEVNPFILCMYLKQKNWNEYPYKRKGVKVFQYTKNHTFHQVTVPMDQTFIDYKRVLCDTIKTIANVYQQPVSQILQDLISF